MEGLRAEQGVGNICDETLRTLYRTKFHVRYTHKQACKDDNECDNRSKLGRQAWFAECISNNFGLTQIGHYTIMRKQTFGLSAAFPFVGCNGTPLRPQNVETSDQKQELLSS